MTNLTVKVPPELSHATALIIAQSPGAEPQIADLKPEILRFDPFTWPGEIPAGCPFARAKAFQADFVNIPSQFIGDDGVTMWRRYSGGFSLDQEGKPHPDHPPGGHYGMTFQKIQLLRGKSS